jgi:hypothetical protein
MRSDRSGLIGRALRLGAAMLAIASFAAHAATFDIINIDDPGVGFNEATPATPVGGNAGTTLGEQRQIVFDFVAKFWGSKLNSDVSIQVLATFAPLSCTSTSGVLGAAGAWNIFTDFPNAKKAATWYPGALANKLAGVRLADDPDPFVSADIVSFFNGDLGKPGCLDGLSFYLGLDGNAGPNQIDLVTTVLHEFGHGLGFQTFTDDATGQYVFADANDPGLPSIWDHYLFDPQQRKTWVQMTPEERAQSAITPRNLVWGGTRVTQAAPTVLDRGTPELFVLGRGLNDFLFIGPAAFGPPIDRHTLIAAELAAVVDQPDGRGLACTPLDATNAAAVRGRVAIIDRGSCAFTVKVKNAQLAGAKAVLVADNVAGTPPNALAGADDTITIPSARIARDDGARLKAALPTGKRAPKAFAVLFDNLLKLSGADYLNRVYMWTPNPHQPGSSVSHYDVLAKPDLLMEPFDTPGLGIAVSAPNDLTLELLQDIGW